MEKKISDKYIETIGRRKTATARVRMTPASKTSYVINDKELAAYFPTKQLQDTVTSAITDSKTVEKFKVTVVTKGGGVAGQAIAVRHGIARGLNEFDALLRPVLKKAGFLKRDPRAKERRKFGLKKARKAPQWSKR
ncbi:MAG: 30S ribosomal protein S9 [Candidatus Pacebacteria bacterium]|jgi:small subunit ribosomal protein S9|nr:30S ribosomal protein S9 [Candidatus Paceibacterota bacterium]